MVRGFVEGYTTMRGQAVNPGSQTLEPRLSTSTVSSPSTCLSETLEEKLPPCFLSDSSEDQMGPWVCRDGL